MAEKMKTVFLGSLPLTELIREGGDEGAPVAMKSEDTSGKSAFLDIAQKVTEEVSKLSKK